LRTGKLPSTALDFGIPAGMTVFAKQGMAAARRKRLTARPAYFTVIGMH
jgi:hypothetical protein